MRVGKMTKEFAQACGWLLIVLQCSCTAEQVADSANTAEREQSAMVQSVLRNVAAPTQAQLLALQSPGSQRAFIHDEVPFEMWHFFGFTADAQMRQLGYSSRISRLNVRDNNGDTQASPWDFTDVMVLESDLVDIESTAQHATQQVERVALELAGTDSNTQKVWVGATTVEKLAAACETRYRLNLPRLDPIQTVQAECGWYKPGVGRQIIPTRRWCSIEPGWF